MITFHSISDLSEIAGMKTAYLGELLEPLDDMWEQAFTDPSPHTLVRVDDEDIGYFAVSEMGSILQFYVKPAYRELEAAIFRLALDRSAAKSADVGTADPCFLALCLDQQTSIAVHTHVYALNAAPALEKMEGIQITPVSTIELKPTVQFQKVCLDGDDNLTEWLSAYSGNLIERKELFRLSRGSEWIGLGECRHSDSQQGVAHLGMMVHPDHRGLGWATYILATMRDRAIMAELRPVCSTTVDNPAAQKAIERAGFVSRHRIVKITF